MLFYCAAHCPSGVAWCLSVCFALLLGLIHIPILLGAGRELFLVLTAITQLVLKEFWYAIPQITGGSGGVLLPEGSRSGGAITAFCVAALAVSLTMVHLESRKAIAFDWARFARTWA
jgi:ABC-type branched-subunit amino acid transport system permease subunit